MKSIHLKKLLPIVLVFSLLSCTKNANESSHNDSNAHVNKEHSQNHAEKFPEISYLELTKKINNPKVTIVDVNSQESYTKGHIPSAISYATNASNLAKVLPVNKDSEIIVYCGSPMCGAWKKGAKAAEALGYTNVKHFAGGIKGFKEAGGKLEA